MANKQVRSVRKNHGRKFHKEIGSIGGILSPTKFTPETARIASNIRWNKYRLEKKGEEDGHQQTNDSR